MPSCHRLDTLPCAHACYASGQVQQASGLASGATAYVGALSAWAALISLVLLSPPPDGWRGAEPADSGLVPKSAGRASNASGTRTAVPLAVRLVISTTMRRAATIAMRRSVALSTKPMMVLMSERIISASTVRFWFGRLPSTRPITCRHCQFCLAQLYIVPKLAPRRSNTAKHSR